MTAKTSNITLNADVRAERGERPSGRLRLAGKLPGVIYGKGGESISVTVDHLEFRRLFQDLDVRAEEFTLTVGGATERVKIQEIQRDPVRGVARHVDFLRV